MAEKKNIPEDVGAPESPKIKTRLNRAGSKEQEQAQQVQELSPPEKGGEPPAKTRKAFPVVGIGASAGGLEALETFFSTMPADGNMAFVIIQHLSPNHKSIMGQILKKDTRMPVLEIQDGMELELNCVYFNPPNREVAIYQGVFHLVEPAETRYTRLPIDYFFRSLAQDLEEKAICIVLSGTGSDGTLGLEAVKGAGGMTMAQAEEQAKYPFMPRSAIDTGLVDYVLPVEEMPGELIRYVKHPYLESREKDLTPDNHYQNFLSKILMLVRANTKHDFSHYKQTTIRRRVGRRMAVHKIEGIADYFRYLQQNPAEIQTLFKDLIICVTSFFRDPEAFKSLETRVIPDILARKPDNAPVRIWVPGCGTGEESLSMAILLAEAMERVGKHFQVQIFATDIDPEAIDKARAGVYPESIGADVSSDRLKRFFIKKDDRYKIKQDIREMVVYAVQNLISDPPFSHLELISCRNVLIYLDNDLQRQLLPLFHFTLNPNGYLFLGSSETIGGFADLFAPTDTKWKIFQRKGPVVHHLTEYSALNLPVADFRPLGKAEPRPVDVRTLIEKIVLNEYTPPSVLVNSKYDILYFQGQTNKFLVPPLGEPSFNLFSMTREELRPKLITAMHQAITEKKTIVSQDVHLTRGDEILQVNMTVRPLIQPGVPANLFLVVFEDQAKPPQPKMRGKAALRPEEETRVAVLEHELQATKEYLQTTVEELEASNEELKSTNEELQSTNEELQSTNEELETAKEELQSTNEELLTVNSELQNKLDELIEVNNDINNLLASTEIGTVFLDRELRIKRFTPVATRLFNLIASDIGRSIKDITTKTGYDRLWGDAEEVLHTLQVKEMNLKSDTDQVFSIRLLPYRTRENIIDGVVLTFMDLSEMRLLTMAKLFAESIVNTVREPLLVLDGELQVVSANQAFYSNFKVTREETEKRPIYELGAGQWNIPELRKRLEEIISQDGGFADFKMEQDFPQIGPRVMVLNARRIPAGGDRPHLILLAIEDVTGRG